MIIYLFTCKYCYRTLEAEFSIAKAPPFIDCCKKNSAKRDLVAENSGFILKGSWPGKDLKEDSAWDKKTQFTEKKKKLGKYGRRKGYFNKKTGTHDSQKLMDEWNKMSSKNDKN